MRDQFEDNKQEAAVTSLEVRSLGVGTLCEMLLSAARIAAFVTPATGLWIRGAGVRTRFVTTAANSSTPKPKREEVRVTFVKADGSRQTAKGRIGQNLLDIIVDNSVDIDGFGACEGTLACST